MSRDCLVFCFFKTGCLHSRLSPSLQVIKISIRIGRILLFCASFSPHNYLKCFLFSHIVPTPDLPYTGFNLPTLMGLLPI